jgi:hypothetical protein
MTYSMKLKLDLVLEIEWILIIHNNCVFPFYGCSIETSMDILYGFSGQNCKFYSMDFTFFSQSDGSDYDHFHVVQRLQDKRYGEMVIKSRPVNIFQTKHKLNKDIFRKNYHLKRLDPIVKTKSKI